MESDILTNIWLFRALYIGMLAMIIGYIGNALTCERKGSKGRHVETRVSNIFMNIALVGFLILFGVVAILVILILIVIGQSLF